MLYRIAFCWAMLGAIANAHAVTPDNPANPEPREEVSENSLHSAEPEAAEPFAGKEGSGIFVPNILAQPTIDGRLDEAVWRKANTVSLGFITQPFENTTAPVSTQVKLFENGETLFLTFIAEDPNPQAIRAFYRDRDKIWNNDLVGVKLDTFNNSRLAYQFFVNPFGVQADAIENEMTGMESDSWNAIWDSAGEINDAGYVVEIAIPLQTMNFEEGEGDKIWRAELVRFYPREDRLRISNLPYDRDNACTLCQMGEVSGFKSVSQSANLALVPTLVASASESRDPIDNTPWESSDNIEVGLDVKWGITPQVSLQATLNPDFSQVEADVAQVSINNTFSLFFDERRPFFVENAGYFTSNQNLVYTRNIGEPDYGGKVTGQTGDHTFGIFVANDVMTRFIVPGNLGSSVAEFDAESVNGALRYRYDVNDDLSVGWVSTFREADSYHNYVNGLDVKYRLTGQDTIQAQYVVSDTRYPENLYQDFCSNDCSGREDENETVLRTRLNDNIAGASWRVNYRHEERNWFVVADHFVNDENFRADLGFEPRADFTKSIFGGGYMWWNDSGWWNRIRVNGDWDISHNDNGELLEKEAEIYASIRGTMQSYLEFGHLERERVGLRHDGGITAVDGNTDLFTERSNSMYFETRPSPVVFVSTFARVGDQIDFANNRLGDQVYIESAVDMNIGEHAQVSLRHIYSDLDAGGAPLFTARLSDLRVTYQFDPRQYLRLIVAYSNIDRNTSNYLDEVEPLTRTVGAQLLYSYKVNPLTKFFVGVASASLQEAHLNSITEAERSVFMKFSYAWLQ